MLTYTELKKNVRQFVSLTSLTPEEFDHLLPTFEQAYQQAFPDSQTKTGQIRKQKAGGGRKGALETMTKYTYFR